MTNHWHVSIHSEDDDVYITDDLFAALDYAAQELDRAADFEHDGVSVVAAKVEDARSWGKKYPDVYEMEEALLSFAKCERYANLMLNARNMVKQHNADTDDRAPLYSADPYAGARRRSPQQPTAGRRAAHRTRDQRGQSARHLGLRGQSANVAGQRSDARGRELLR